MYITRILIIVASSKKNDAFFSTFGLNTPKSLVMRIKQLPRRYLIACSLLLSYTETYTMVKTYTMV